MRKLKIKDNQSMKIFSENCETIFLQKNKNFRSWSSKRRKLVFFWGRGEENHSNVSSPMKKSDDNDHDRDRDRDEKMRVSTPITEKEEEEEKNTKQEEKEIIEIDRKSTTPPVVVRTRFVFYYDKMKILVVCGLENQNQNLHQFLHRQDHEVKL